MIHFALENPLVVLIGAIAIALLIAVARRQDGPVFSPYQRRRLLTQHEVVMLAKLREALHGSGYDVFPQVAMGALMDVKRSVDNHRRLALRNRFDRKIVDFVIADRSGNALLLVELDDSSHVSSRDAERDRLTASAGYRTLRFRNARRIDPQRMRDEIKGILAER